MTIRISEPLVCLMLDGANGHGDRGGPKQEAIEEAGAKVQSILVESVAHPTRVLCPACLAEQDMGKHSPHMITVVCWKCGAAFISFWRSWKYQPGRWYSFKPF